MQIINKNESDCILKSKCNNKWKKKKQKNEQKKKKKRQNKTEINKMHLNAYVLHPQ